MSFSWIDKTPSLSNGVTIINKIDASKFPELLSRIFNSTESTETFGPNEYELLEKSLNLTNNELKSLIDTLQYIVKRSRMFLMKPTVLQEELVEKLIFNPEKAQYFVKAWTENVKKDCPDFENRNKLQNFSWELNLEAATDCDFKTTNLTSLLQFEIKDTKEKTKFLTMEMNEEQLIDLYNQIERIQSTLDNINK